MRRDIGGRRATARGRRGVTLLELIIVIAIIAILLTLFFPVLRMLRESSLRTACSNNLRQLYLGLSQYTEVHRGYFPDPAKEFQPGGWAVELLPFIEEGPLYSRINTSETLSSPGNLAVLAARPPLFECPVVPEMLSTIKPIRVTNYLLVIDPKERKLQKRNRSYRLQDAPADSRYPWASSPELPPDEARYEPPHAGVEGVFGF